MISFEPFVFSRLLFKLRSSVNVNFVHQFARNNRECVFYYNFFFFFLSESMNPLCKVCGDPAAGYHFGAFTCEGCKVRCLMKSHLILFNLITCIRRKKQKKNRKRAELNWKHTPSTDWSLGMYTWFVASGWTTDKSNKRIIRRRNMKRLNASRASHSKDRKKKRIKVRRLR